MNTVRTNPYNTEKHRQALIAINTVKEGDSWYVWLTRHGIFSINPKIGTEHGALLCVDNKRRIILVSWIQSDNLDKPRMKSIEVQLEAPALPFPSAIDWKVIGLVE